MLKKGKPNKRYFAMRDEYHAMIDGSSTKAEIHENAKRKILPLLFDDINCWDIDKINPDVVSTRHLTEEGWIQFGNIFEKMFLYNF